MQKGLIFKYEKNSQGEKVTFVFNGCVITITSTEQKASDPLEIVKDILCSLFDASGGRE